MLEMCQSVRTLAVCGGLHLRGGGGQEGVLAPLGELSPPRLFGRYIAIGT